jgi:trigger factor
VKVTKDKIENRQAYLTIEIEPPELEEGLKKAYNRLVQKTKVPGFRKGKAPRSILEQYMGKAALLEDAVEHMAPEAFDKAVEEQALKPIARPEIQLEKAEPVTYKIVVALEPVITLGDYHKIKMEPEAVVLKEEDLNKALENLRHQHAIWEPVDRQVNSHDTVIMDISSRVGDQPYINQNDAEFEVIKESEYPLKGFPEALLGMKKGAAKEFTLTFPPESKHAELAGKEVSFKVALKEIKQERLPEINDDFAKQVSPDLKSLDELKNKINENLKQIAVEKAKKDFEMKIISEIVKVSEVEYPSIMEEQEIDNLIRQQMQRWQMDEKGLDEYLQSIKKTPEQLREEMRPVASKSIKQSLVLSEIARTENIQLEKADLENEIQNMTKDIPSERKEKILEILQMPQSQINIASTIATRKTLALLTSMVQSTAADTKSETTAVEAQADVAGDETAEAETAAPKTKEKKTKKKEAQE